MVGIGGGVVVRHVACTARRWSPGIAVRMTFDARGGHVRSMQREVRVVVIERRIAPSRLIMAHGAIRAKARGRVVGFSCSVVLGHVAGTAGRGCSRITVRVALDARGGCVRTVQREVRVVVVEGGIAPGRLVVAHGAIRAKARGRVVGFSCSVVLGHVAGTAGCRCSCITARMALDARSGRMRSVQREIGDVMIERSRPTRTGGVASGTIRGEPSGLVVRVGGAIVLRHVATGTLRGCISEVARGMATCAVLDIMSTCQREKVVVCELRPPTSTHRIMALDAIRRETRAHVVR